MKFNAKLLVIALIVAMIFSIGAVSAAENIGNITSSDFTQVPHEQVVSVVEPTVQEVETIDLETSDNTEIDQTMDITSSSDNLKSTDSIKNESLRENKKVGPVLGASNQEDVLSDTIYVYGNTFSDLRTAISNARDGDIIDLQNQTIYGFGGQISFSKKITIANGALDGNSYLTNYKFENCILENLTISNLHTSWGTSVDYCNLKNVAFDNVITDKGCDFAVRYCNLENVNFTNCHSLMPADPHEEDFETGVMIVTYGSNFNNCYFVNCSSKRHSGAICVAGLPGNTANITNCVFDNCTSGVGGAVYLHGTGLSENHHSNIINCTFKNCEATEWGGALGSSQDFLNVENCKFENNSAKQGAAFMVGGITHGLDGDNSQGHHNTMKNCYFYNNTGTEEGGAVHITGNYNSAIDCTFDDNFALNGKGAAIYVEGHHASVQGSNFTKHESEMGTVYVEGDDFSCTHSTFEDNYAEHGGAGIYVEGHRTYISDSIFRRNNASMHGGAIHTIGNNARILNSEFRENNAIPSSTNPDYGLGGAIYIDGKDNEISYSKFKHNTARNGSAIYNRGDDLVLNDDLFENNQAWSYFLFTEAKPPEAYWSEDMEFLVNVTLVAGDNLINAIYNDRGIYEIYFYNVTYTLKPTELYPTGIKTTTPEELHPVKGVGNSQGGKYLYQDAREDDQVVNINITFKDGKVFEYTGKTNMYGSVAFPITKENMSDGQFHPGVYTLTAEHPNDDIYTYISNSTKFTILPNVDVSVTKTSDKDVYIIGENATFTIRVSGVGTNATDVRVKDILPDSLKFVSYTATKGTYDSVNNEWYIGFLPHLGSETLTLTVLTTKLGTYDNVVNVTSAERDWNLSNNVDNKTIHVDVYYTKEANVTNVSAGENLEYYLRVFNTGSSDYTQIIQIRDTLPQGIRYLGQYELQGADLVRYINYGDQQIWYITNITAGTRAKITIKAKALEEGLWNNTMNVWDLPEVNATVNVTHNADLEIIKTVSVPQVSKGDIINWTVVVINHGPSVASDVVVKDILPYGLEQYGLAIPDYPTRFDRNTGTWTIGTLEVERPVKLIIPTRVTIYGRNITNTANVTSTTPDPVPENNEDNETVEFYPDVTVVKTVSNRTTSHGSIVTWTIKVTNNGPHDATGVYIIDKLPAGLRYVVSTADVGEYMPGSGRWTIGDLAENQSVTLTINTEVTVYDGFITNNVTVYAPNDGDPTNNFDEDYTEVITKADVGVVKLVSSQTSRYGDEITWTIRVTNYGPNVAKNVVLIDYLPINDLQQTKQPHVSKGQISHEGVTGRWDIGDMAVGETQYMEVYTKVIKTNQTIINTVVVTSDTDDPNPSNNRAENGTVVPPEADVQVIKRVSNFTPNKYDNVNWTITVYNAGPNVAENVVVTDVLPNGLRYVSNAPPTGGKGTYSHTSNTWNVGTLEVGVRYELTITTQVVDTGRITNEVNVTTSTYDTNLTNNYDNETIDVPAIADLEITKIVSNKTPKYGDVITWTITVHNNGPNNARNVVVNDTLPAGLIYMTHKVSVGLYDYAQGIWQIGDLGIDKTVTLTITTRVNVTNATITNVAVVNSTTPDNDTTNNEANNTTDVDPMADLAIDKTVDNHGPKKGDNITWIITVVNKGPDAAINAFAIDILPNGLTFVNASGNGTYDKDTNIWTIGDIENGGSRVLYIVTTVEVSEEVITNTVNVTSETPDPDLTNNEDNSTIDVGHEADLGIIKTVSNSTPKFNDEITWTITVKNNGPDDAVDIYVNDTLPKGLVWISDNGNGTYNHNTGIWTIGNLTNQSSITLIIRTLVNVTNANITNIAVVDSDTYDPNPENNTDNDTINVRPEADLEVIKVVSNKKPHFGENITWTITVINNGPNDAVDVYVNDTLPKGLIYQTDDSNGKYNPETGVWTIGNLTNGARVVLNIKTLVNITNATITNVAVVNSTTPDNNTDNNKGNNTTDVDPEADLEIIKLVSNKTAQKGDVITWTIVVTNKGPDSALEVYVRDKMPTGLVLNKYSVTKGMFDQNTMTWYIKSLAKGESQTLTLNTLVNVSNTTLVNYVNVTNDVYDPNETNNEANNTTVVNPKADLVVVKVVSNPNAKFGEIITWTVTVTNKGPDTAVNTRVTDKLPAGLIFLGSNGNYDNNTGVWIVGDLANGASASLVIRTQVNITNDTIRNVANATSDTPGNSTPGNNTTDVEPKANLVVEKFVSANMTKTGDVITWTIKVTNNGPDTSVNTRVTDKLPDGLIYTGHKGEGNYDPESGVWIIGDLANGESKILEISTIVNITNKTIVNVANVTSDTPGNRTNGTNNTTSFGNVADLEVIKLVSNATPKRGDEITWTIIVTNHGPDKAIGVNVTDKLPAGLRYNGHDGPGFYDSSKGIWIIGDLAKDDTVKLVIRTIVEISNGTIENIAVVNSSTPDNNTDNNKGNNTTTVNDDADLVIVKVVSNKNPKFGEEITWTITVTNKGPSDAKNVRVTDKLPAGLIFNGSNGNYNPATGLWIVGDLANGKSVSLVIKTIVNITNTTITNIANVTSDTPDSNKTNNEANNTTDVGPKADLIVVKEVSKQTVKTGELITWTVTVTNKGPDTAVNTRVTDKLPAGLIFITSDGNYDPITGVWIVGDLANGASASLVIRTQVNITNATIRNVANATSDTPGNDTPGNNTTDVDPKADLVVVKVVSNKNPKFGEEITWTVTVTNKGPDTAVNVRVTDKLPAGLIFNGANGNYDPITGVWIVGDLANGASASLVIRTQVNITNATIRNVANATSDTPGNDTPGNNTTDVDPKADLVVVKVVSNKNPKFGEEITWTVTVTNKGPDTAVNVRVTDKLPAGLIFNGANGNYDPITGVWIVGDLANGASASLVIRTQVNITNATIRNVANATSDTPGNNTPGNNTTYVPPEADLEIIKLVSNKTTSKGEIITWTIIVTNHGPDAAENVYVKDSLPNGLELKSYTRTKGLFDSNSMTWFINKLNNGESATLTINTLVNVSDVTLVNYVNATNDVYDPNESNNKANNTTTVDKELGADLAIIKVVSDSNPRKGDIINWIIVVTNNGPGDAHGVTVTDKLPAGLIFKGADGNYNPDTGIWTIGDLKNGQTISLVITTLVDITNAQITNVAVVNSTTPDNNTDNNKDNDTTNVDPEADIKVIKTVSNPTPTKGDTITWTITVINLGPDAAKDVIVEDDLPEGLKLLSVRGSKGAFDSGIWTIGTLNKGESATLVITTQVTTSGTTIRNIAVGTTTTYDPNKTNNRDSDVTRPKDKPVAPSADLEIIKYANVEKVKVGDKIIWKISVYNYGPDAAENVRVKDVLYGDAEYLSSKASKGTFDPLEGVWIIGDMKVGEEVVLTIICKALSEGIVVNTAEVVSDTPDPNMSNNKDMSVVNVEKGDNPVPPTPETPKTPENPETPATMHATGNPIVMVLLALFALVGVSLRRKD
ncbi:CARDB domain-containing protein [uncultured Methanobrevibacter sp.]|uniref:CARDB domain-containing protein n=1 Tax=uncultured Methanobrevibacter sp. TaxID=253161 RepID=UPI0025CC0EB3|nr:CARDB domain-containing protein [uncultured Methanobrevibacter sp.]